MSADRQAVLNWLNTFDVTSSRPVGELGELVDGTVLLMVLAEISPSHFEVDALQSVPSGTNWALCLSNLKKLLRLVEEFFSSSLGKRVDTTTMDLNAIAKDGSEAALFDLLEVVVGAAVMCADKKKFIEKIFSLDGASQTMLKGMVERVMRRTQALEEDEDEDGGGEEEEEEEEEEGSGGGGGGGTGGSTTKQAAGGAGGGGGDEALLREREMVRHLQEERQRLINEVSRLESSNGKLTSQWESMRDKLADIEREKEASEGTDRSRTAAAASLTERLQADLAEVRREMDLQTVENDSLKAELRLSAQRFEQTKEMQAKLEMEHQQMSDELDIARDTRQKLAKAEAIIDKYKGKLEEANLLKKENKLFEARLDEYSEKIHRLESENKTIETMQKRVDRYKDESVKMEREKFEAVSALQMQEHQVAVLKQELEDAEARILHLEEEFDMERKEFARKYQEESEAHNAELSISGLAEGEEGGSGGGGGIGEEGGATPFEMREKIKKLEAELRAFKLGMGGVGGVVEGSGSGGIGGGVGASAGDQQELALLQSELEDVKRAKKEREELYLAAKKQMVEIQVENERLNKALQEAESGGGGGAAAAAAAAAAATASAASTAAAAAANKQVSQQLAQTQNTVKLLEERLKEKEGTINKLEQEKAKLENFSKSSLVAFKEKYMAALSHLAAEKKSLEGALERLADKSEKNRETSRREERLLLSAMYELGVKIMDNNISKHIGEGGLGSVGGTGGGGGGGGGVGGGITGASGGGTFLSNQRQTLLRSHDSAAERIAGNG